VSKKWHVWMEGYLATGMEGIPAEAMLVGIAREETFQAAAYKACRAKFKEECDSYYRIHEEFGYPIFWGCRLYDNEIDARRSYG
jgi:hypothetical protein